MIIKFPIYYLPALFTVWVFGSLVVSYIVTVATDNISFLPFIPYISELGVWQPSNCSFGQIMNITALLSIIVLYVRYRQIDLAISTNTTKLNKRWNEMQFWLGLVISFGISIVANFQGNMAGNLGVFLMHLLGASMAFGIAGIYLVIHVKMSFELRPYYEKFPQFEVSKRIQHLRLLSVIVYLLNLVMVVGFALATPRESNGYRIQGLLPGDDGYDCRLVSVLSEWNLLFILLLNLLTMTNEFRVLSYEGIHFKRLNEHVINV